MKTKTENDKQHLEVVIPEFKKLVEYFNDYKKERDIQKYYYNFNSQNSLKIITKIQPATHRWVVAHSLKNTALVIFKEISRIVFPTFLPEVFTEVVTKIKLSTRNSQFPGSRSRVEKKNLELAGDFSSPGRILQFSRNLRFDRRIFDDDEIY